MLIRKINRDYLRSGNEKALKRMCILQQGMIVRAETEAARILENVIA